MRLVIASRDRPGAVPGACGTVLLPRICAMSGHWGKMKPHRDAGGPLCQCANGRAVQAQDQVALPVARDRSVISLCWPFADHDLRGDERFAPARTTQPRNPKRSSSAQTRRQFLPKRSAALNMRP